MSCVRAVVYGPRGKVLSRVSELTLTAISLPLPVHARSGLMIGGALEVVFACVFKCIVSLRSGYMEGARG